MRLSLGGLFNVNASICLLYADRLISLEFLGTGD